MTIRRALDTVLVDLSRWGQETNDSISSARRRSVERSGRELHYLSNGELVILHCWNLYGRAIVTGSAATLVRAYEPLAMTSVTRMYPAGPQTW